MGGGVESEEIKEEKKLGKKLGIKWRRWWDVERRWGDIFTYFK